MPWTGGQRSSAHGHRATLLAISRGTHTIVNPRVDFSVERSDDLLVVAESLGTLAPLRPDRAMGTAGRPAMPLA